MQPQGGSIWGNINLCIEIALNIYYIVGNHEEGIMIPKKHAEETFSDKTVAAGKESDGCLYYPKGETMDMPLYEMMLKRAAMARKMELAAAGQMEEIRKRGNGMALTLLEGIEPPPLADDSARQIREGIFLTGGEEPRFMIHEKAAEYFLSPYACEFGRNENGYFSYTLQSAAIPLYELKKVFPECRDMIVSEESLLATICTSYPAYREEYNAVVPKEEQIPLVEAPENLFLQEQLDRVQMAVDEAVQEKMEEEDEEYGEQVYYGLEG